MLSLLAELQNRDTAAATRLRERVERELMTRQQSRLSRSRASQTRNDGAHGQRAGGWDEAQSGFSAQRHADVALTLEQTQTRLREALAQEARARAELEAFRSRAKEASDSVFGRVYLAWNAPKWLVIETQRAFRAKYDPDRFDEPERRATAARILLEAESVFAKILSL